MRRGQTGGRPASGGAGTERRAGRSLAIAQLNFAYKYRSIISVVVFIILNVVLFNLYGLLTQVFPWSSVIITPESMAGLRNQNIALTVTNIFNFLVSVGCFLGTNYILKNKLNLQ